MQDIQHLLHLKKHSQKNSMNKLYDRNLTIHSLSSNINDVAIEYRYGVSTTRKGEILWVSAQLGIPEGWEGVEKHGWVDAISMPASITAISEAIKYFHIHTAPYTLHEKVELSTDDRRLIETERLLPGGSKNLYEGRTLTIG